MDPLSLNDVSLVFLIYRSLANHHQLTYILLTPTYTDYIESACLRRIGLRRPRFLLLSSGGNIPDCQASNKYIEKAENQTAT